MISLSLIKALNGGLWLMQPEAALTYQPLVNKIINGDDFAFKPKMWKDDSEEKEIKPEFKVVSLSATTFEPQWQKFEKAVPGSVAVIPLKDVVMQEDFCGSPGLNTLQSWMTKAENNANIIGMIIDTDSPGGSAQGVDEFAQFIKTLKKPVVSFVGGMACSAGYWIPSASNEIIIANKLCMLGSIGAFSTFYDSSKAREMRGYREIQVYAPQSTMKNKLFRDITSADKTVADNAQAQYANRFLKPLVEDFQNTVKANRSAHVLKMSADVLAGDVFTGTESLANGLADSFGNFNYAINRVQELAKKQAA